MQKKIITSIILTLVMILLEVPLISKEVFAREYTAAEIGQKIDELKDKYAEHSVFYDGDGCGYWRNEAPITYTYVDQGCFASYCSTIRGSECWSFARTLFYEMFGERHSDYTDYKGWTDKNDLYVGDVLTGSGHSIFIIDIINDEVYFADANDGTGAGCGDETGVHKKYYEDEKRQLNVFDAAVNFEYCKSSVGPGYCRICWSRHMSVDSLFAIYGYGQKVHYPGNYVRQLDHEAPVIEGDTLKVYDFISEPSKAGFKIEASVKDNWGVSKVWVDITSREVDNFKVVDTIYDGFVGEYDSSNDCWVINFEISQFKHKPLGKYSIKIYAEDESGNRTEGVNKLVQDFDIYKLDLCYFEVGKRAEISASNTPIRCAPYKELGGIDTTIYKIEHTKHTRPCFTILGVYYNEYGNKWYKISSGVWVYSENVKILNQDNEVSSELEELKKKTAKFIEYNGKYCMAEVTNRRLAVANYIEYPLEVTSYSSQVGGGSSTIGRTRVVVNFDVNGGIGSQQSKTVYQGYSYGALPIPSRYGYTFDGWFTAAEDGTQITETTICSRTDTHTLYAHWTRIILLEGDCGDNLHFILYGDGELYFEGYGEMTSHPWTDYEYSEYVFWTEIPDTVNKVCENAFSGCSSLYYVDLPNKITEIEDGTFFRCTYLRAIIIPETVTIIGSSAFGESGLEEIDIPAAVTEIGTSAFCACENLSKVTLHDGIKKISKHCFDDCTSLEKMWMPKTVTEDPGEDVWYQYYHVGIFGGSGLKEVEFEEGTTYIATSILMNADKLEKVNIPNTVTEIGAYAFANCSSLKSVNIPENVSRIGGNAFSYSGLETIDIPAAVIEIGVSAFESCENLSKVTLHDGLKKISKHCFDDCTSLENIWIPKTVTEDPGEDVWYQYYHVGVFGGSGLKEVEFENGITTVAVSLLMNATNLEKVYIPDTVTEIGSYAFDNCSSLKKIVIPEKVTKIGSYAFANSGLEGVIIPKCVSEIGRSSFYDCKELKSISLPDTIDIINPEMFSGCDKLESIIIPQNVKKIGYSAFLNNTSLTEIKWNEVITKIDNYAFSGCSSIEVIEIPDSVDSIGARAFENCDSLKSVKMGKSVSSIDEYIFYDCDKLTDVKLGNYIKYIPDGAFAHCDLLKEIVIPSYTTDIYSGAFVDSVLFSKIVIRSKTSYISENAFSYLNKLTIYGNSGSYAEEYANEYDIKFVDNSVKAEKILLSDDRIELVLGESTRLNVNITPYDFSESLILKSSNTEIVDVKADGTINAVGVGEATVKIAAGDVVTSCKVVVKQYITNINIYSINEMECGDSYTISYSIWPYVGDNVELSWESSDDSIVSVDHNGVIYAHKKGTAVIRVTAKDGGGCYAEGRVVVKNDIIDVNSTDKFESKHNYENNSSDKWIYENKDAESISLTFDINTELEEDSDYLIIYNSNGEISGKYSGRELSGKTVTILGSKVEVQLASDDSINAWGFKVTKIDISKHEKESVNSIFRDVPDGKWYSNEVLYIYKRGAMTGKSEGIFDPLANIQRSETIAMLYKLEGSPKVDISIQLFPDVSSKNWYNNAAIWGKTNGIISGLSSGPDAGKFMPKNQITRQDFTKILYEYAKFKGYDVSVKSSTSYTKVEDADKISKYARECMNWGYENQFIANGSNFKPKDNITRREAAVMLARFLEKYDYK